MPQAHHEDINSSLCSQFGGKTRKYRPYGFPPLLFFLPKELPFSCVSERVKKCKRQAIKALLILKQKMFKAGLASSETKLRHKAAINTSQLLPLLEYIPLKKDFPWPSTKTI